MGKLALNFIVVVDWGIHENAAVLAERSALFWFSKDVCPHYFSRAVNDIEVTIVNFVTHKRVPAFDVFSAFGSGERAVNLLAHGRLAILEEDVLFNGVTL